MYRIIDINSYLKLIHFIAYLFFFSTHSLFFSLCFAWVWVMCAPCSISWNALLSADVAVEMIARTPKQFMRNSHFHKYYVSHTQGDASVNERTRDRESFAWKSMQILIRNWCYRHAENFGSWICDVFAYVCKHFMSKRRIDKFSQRIIIGTSVYTRRCGANGQEREWEQVWESEQDQVNIYCCWAENSLLCHRYYLIINRWSR